VRHAGTEIRPLTAAFDADEHAAHRRRLRHAGSIALAAWLFFAALDLFIVGFVHPGRPWFYLLVRATGILAAVPVLAWLLRRMPTPRGLRLADAYVCTLMSVLTSIACCEFGGITSPLVFTVLIVLLGRGALLTEHWRHSAVAVVPAALAHPLTLLVCAHFSPAIAAQFREPHSLGMFVFHQILVAAAALLTLVGGHLVWSLRRQLFESRTLGKYRLKQRIGRGSMGEVWVAHHSGLKTEVAVKILRSDHRVSHTAIARFEREVRACSSLTHPNVIRIYDHGVTADNLWYYAMELLEGCDLGTLLSREGVIAPQRAVGLLAQVASALGAAHERGVIHRDIKPENLFVTSVAGGDFVKILDFGLAKVVTCESDPTITRAGWTVGTPNYLAPELITGAPADARSDIYALGAVAYHLLCGAPPFESQDSHEVLVAHVQEQPVPPSQKLGRPLPALLEQIVMRCLAKRPELRYQSAHELAAALSGCAAQLEERPAPVAAVGRLRLLQTA
jgi:serine/threonine-protein kinase